ncbi:MAG: dienelactone hydrolase family protein [Planctomycetota bacterium]
MTVTRARRMATGWRWLGLALLAALGSGGASRAALAEVRTKVVKYQHGDLECRGYLAWDDKREGNRPGILLVHEWWGLNDYARQRAEQLAALGYVAFAADMYGEGKIAQHPQEAGQMAAKVRENVTDWRKRAATALEVLKTQSHVDARRLGVIGYCFGGSTALQLAYTGADVQAVATFHAALPAATAPEAKQVKAKILVCHGADDSFIPPAAIQAFRGALDEAKVSYEFVAYPGARHSFTVKDADKHGIEGLKYNAAADEQSWRQMQQLFKSVWGL